MVDSEKLGFELGYNRCLEEMVRERGLPKNSQKPFFLDPAQLVQLLEKSNVRHEAGAAVAHPDGRSVSLGEKLGALSSSGRGRLLPVGERQLCSVVWPADPEQVLLACWDGEKLERAWNVRSGLILQCIRICREPCKRTMGPWQYVHLHD